MLGAPKAVATSKRGLTKPALTPREAHRVFVTLPSPALLGQREETFILRKRLADRIAGLTIAMIPTISPTMTGWALFPSDLAARDILLAEPNQPLILRALGGTKISVPEVWFDYVIPLIPAAFHGIEGAIEVTQDLVSEEAFH